MKRFAFTVCLILLSVSVQASFYPYPFNRSVFVTTPAINTDPDTSTGAVSKIDFNEGSGGTTIDSISPTLTGNLFTSRVQTSMWTSTGANNTAAVVVGPSTGTISFQDDDRWSGHQGASGQQSWCMTINQTEQTSLTNYTYISKGLATGQYEFSIDWGNACSAADKFSVNYFNTASVKTCAEIPSFTVSVTTSICWSYDISQGAGSKIKIYRGNINVTGTTVDNSITTTNGTSPLIIGRRETQAQPGAAILDRIRVFNYVASKETVANYNSDLLVISRMKQDPSFKWWYANYLAPYGLSTTDIVNGDYYFKNRDNGNFMSANMIANKIGEREFKGVTVLAK